MGTRRVRCRNRAQRADPVVRWLLGLPLVSRDGSRVLRGHRSGRRDEPVVRQREGGSRRTSRCRRDLHGRSTGADRARRLADDGVPHACRQTVLRRHLLPEAAVHAADVHHRRRVAQQAGRRPAERRSVDGGPRSHHADPTRGRSAGHGDGQRSAPAARSELRCRMGWLRSRPEIPQHDEPRSGAALISASPQRGRCNRGDHLARCNGQRRHVRPHRRWLRPIQRGPRMVGAALREDAVRPGAAGAQLRARLAGVRA
ncbi:unannotated protein [freshwater metagenome]|uniref:Unannotated protein n=1 Tax=freshwater metagenome TaxID=449393 RepID=A0A6J7FFP2_9ZZZZ